MTEDVPAGGHIRLHRRIREHPYWGDPDRLRAWLDVLLMAAWRPHRRLVGTEQVELQRGEVILSERFLADRWGWSRGRVRRFLESCLREGELEVVEHRPRNGTTYLVVRYGLYQGTRPTNSTTNGPPNGTANKPTNGTTQVVETEGDGGGARPTNEPTSEPTKRTKEKEVTTKKEKNPMGSKRKKRSRATQLPDDWEPNEKHRELARGMGLVMESELAHFKDYHTARGSTFKDWDAAFRTWLRKSREFKHGTAPTPGSTGAGVTNEKPRGTEKPVQEPPEPQQRSLEVDPELKARVKAYRHESPENEARLERLWDQVQKEVGKLYKKGKNPDLARRVAEHTFFQRARKLLDAA